MTKAQSSMSAKRRCSKTACAPTSPAAMTARRSGSCREIRDFEYIVTSSNMEALILECNLIKQHHPRYNVLLKDDKIVSVHQDHERGASAAGGDAARREGQGQIFRSVSERLRRPADEEAAGPAVSAAQMQDAARQSVPVLSYGPMSWRRANIDGRAEARTSGWCRRSRVS